MLSFAARPSCQRPRCPQIVVVFDVREFNMRQLDFGLSERITKVMDHYYPERAKQVLIVGAPVAGSACSEDGDLHLAVDLGLRRDLDSATLVKPFDTMLQENGVQNPHRNVCSPY